MSNTFWAVFFGTTLGLFSVNVFTATLDDIRHKKRHKELKLVLDQLEDLDYEDYEK